MYIYLGRNASNIQTGSTQGFIFLYTDSLDEKRKFFYIQNTLLRHIYAAAARPCWDAPKHTLSTCSNPTLQHVCAQLLKLNARKTSFRIVFIDFQKEADKHLSGVI